MNIFSNNLKELRTKKGLTQNNLAEQIGISRNSLIYYEKGERSHDIDTIIKLADFFNVSCDYLLRGIETENLDIHKELGLSNKTIETIKDMDTKGIRLNDEKQGINISAGFIFNYLAENGYLISIIEAISTYVCNMCAELVMKKKLLISLTNLLII